MAAVFVTQRIMLAGVCVGKHNKIMFDKYIRTVIRNLGAHFLLKIYESKSLPEYWFGGCGV
jgi:hypothetical protein